MDSKRNLKVWILLILSAILVVVILRRVADEDSIDETGEETVQVSQKPISVNPEAEAPNPEISKLPEELPIEIIDQYADKPAVDINSWELCLANRENLLPSDFIPDLTLVENGQNFDSRAVEALKNFVTAGREVGLSVNITSSYRSYATQETLFYNKVNQYVSSEGSYDAAYIKAATIVAIPGSSEHQTGLAVDIVDRYYEFMNESLADTELSKWMKENCAQYGFILRFPDGKQDITGIMFEPWHYRYVGIEAATYIMEKELCLEEFIALYK